MNYSQFVKLAASNAAVGAGVGALTGGAGAALLGKLIHGNDYDLKKGLAYGLGGAALGGGAGYGIGSLADSRDAYKREAEDFGDAYNAAILEAAARDAADKQPFLYNIGKATGGVPGLNEVLMARLGSQPAYNSVMRRGTAKLQDEEFKKAMAAWTPIARIIGDVSPAVQQRVAEMLKNYYDAAKLIHGKK